MFLFFHKANGLDGHKNIKRISETINCNKMGKDRGARTEFITDYIPANNNMQL